MNKYDFLRKLDRELSALDQIERKELLAFYEERFYNGTIYENKTEEQVIAELESPEEIAKNILSEYGISPKEVQRKTYFNNNKETNEASGLNQTKKKSKFNETELIILIIVDVLLLSWLLPTIFSVVVSIGASLLSYIGVVGFIVGQHTIYDQMIFLFLTGVYIFLFQFFLVVLELLIWTVKKTVLYHLRVFKYKKYADFNKRISKVSVEGWFKRHKLLKFIKNLSGLAALVLMIYSGFFLYSHYEEIEELYINQEYITETYTIENPSNIDLYTFIANIDNMDVEIIGTTGDDIVITRRYHDDTDDVFTITEDGYLVEILHEEDQEYFQFSVSLKEILSLFNSDELIIEIPTSVLLDIVDVEVSNGRIDVESITLDELIVEGSNGTINVTNVIGDNIDLSSSNAAITVRNAKALTTLTVSTLNGKIRIDDTDSEEYDLHTSNGKIVLTNLNVLNQNGIALEARTYNGDISLTDVYVAELDLYTSNGDITYNNEDESFNPDVEHTILNGSYEGNVH